MLSRSGKGGGQTLGALFVFSFYKFSLGLEYMVCSRCSKKGFLSWGKTFLKFPLKVYILGKSNKADSHDYLSQEVRINQVRGLRSKGACCQARQPV